MCECDVIGSQIMLDVGLSWSFSFSNLRNQNLHAKLRQTVAFS